MHLYLACRKAGTLRPHRIKAALMQPSKLYFNIFMYIFEKRRGTTCNSRLCKFQLSEGARYKKFRMPNIKPFKITPLIYKKAHIKIRFGSFYVMRQKSEPLLDYPYLKRNPLQSFFAALLPARSDKISKATISQARGKSTHSASVMMRFCSVSGVSPSKTSTAF